MRMLIRHLLACCCVLLLAAPAAAQDPQVDPGSPAGTEYQLPIDRAREQARARSGGLPGSGGRPSGEAPLFGAGVETKKASPDGQTSGTDSDPGTTTTNVKPDRPASAPATVRAQASAPNSDNALVPIGAGAGGVLLLGALAGMAWRRRTSQR